MNTGSIRLGIFLCGFCVEFKVTIRFILLYYNKINRANVLIEFLRINPHSCSIYNQRNSESSKTLICNVNFSSESVYGGSESQSRFEGRRQK
jgi:hypothetical protein